MIKKLIITVVFALFFILRILPLVNNSFYFTVDQGRDAVYVRDILANHHVYWLGPETTVRGLFTGPLWYYFIAIGYFLFNGHPAGSIVMLILLNAVLLFILYRYFAKQFPFWVSLFLIFCLSFFWPFYDSSRYGFNPFPTVALAFFIIFSLLSRRHWLSFIFIFLAFNCNLAIAAIFFIFCCFYNSRLFHWKISLFLPLLLFSPSLFLVAKRFGEIIRLSLIPQSLFVSIIFLLSIIFLFVVSYRRLPVFVKQWVFLCLGLTIVSFSFLCFSQIQRDWYTVFLPPVLFVSLLLVLLSLPSRFKYFLISVVVLAQTSFFISRYSQYYSVNPTDHGVLQNQLSNIDWIYSQSQGDGFNVYVYADSYFDYYYQYLFPWYGLKKYGYLPCEYSNLPFSDKSNYVPSPNSYSRPTRGCDQSRFLIIDSSTNGETNSDWLTSFRNVTQLDKSQTTGNTIIEKRFTTPLYREYYFKNLIFRHYVEMGFALDIPESWTSQRQGDKMTFSNLDNSFTVIIFRLSSKCPYKPTVQLTGPINNFGLDLKITGPSKDSKELINKITSSFKVVEDDKAHISRNCPSL